MTSHWTTFVQIKGKIYNSSLQNQFKTNITS